MTGQFGVGRGSGAADDQMGLRDPRRQVLEERLNLGWKIDQPIRRA